MAKQTLRRKKHKKSRGLQRKSLGLQRKSRRLDKMHGLDKSRRLQRKSRRLDKNRRIGLQRKSRIQRGGVLKKIEFYTDLMLELLDEVYARYGLPDSQLIGYINGFFGTPRNFIKYIKSRMAQEKNESVSLGELITRSDYNDSRFALSNFKSPEQQQKWINFIMSLQRSIDNMFSSNIDIASEILRHYYELTNPEHIKDLKQYINKLKEGDELGKNALHKALDRMIQTKNVQTTRPSHFLKDIIAQVEHDHPIAAAEINKPKLTANKNTLKPGESVSITPSFESDSATLCVTFPNGKKMIANSDVDDSAINEKGGLKQSHIKVFTYPELPAGIYVLQLMEHPNEQNKSDLLTITVSKATEAGAVASSRPAPAAEAGAAPAPATEAGAATATARPAVEAGAAVVRPGFFQRLRSSFINPENLISKINRRIAVLETFFQVNPSSDQIIVHRLKQQTRTNNIHTLVTINNTLKELLAKHES